MLSPTMADASLIQSGVDPTASWDGKTASVDWYVNNTVFDITYDNKISNRDVIRIITLLTDPAMP